jgi:hypothetical protein
MRTHRRINWDLIIGGAVMVLMALLTIYCYIMGEVREIGQDSVTVVAEDRSPKLDQALKSLADAWREENRNRN